MSRIRTFVAVELADAVCVRASELIERLRTSGANLKWVERDRMHITLKFLGDVDEREVHEVCRSVSDAAREVPAFSLHCGGAAAFPDVERPRTPWLGVVAGSQQLSLLQESIEQSLFQLGYPKEARRFHPHLTLGRLRGGGQGLPELTQRLKKFADFDAGISIVDEVVVMSSFLESGGPTYLPLARIQLRGSL